MLENLGIGEILFVVLAVLVLFGPDGVRSVIREVGQTVNKIKKTGREIVNEMSFPASQRTPESNSSLHDQP